MRKEGPGLCSRSFFLAVMLNNGLAVVKNREEYHKRTTANETSLESSNIGGDAFYYRNRVVAYKS